MRNWEIDVLTPAILSCRMQSQSVGERARYFIFAHSIGVDWTDDKPVTHAPKTDDGI